MRTRWTFIVVGLLALHCSGGFDAAAAARTCPADFPTLPPDAADGGGTGCAVAIALSGAQELIAPCFVSAVSRDRTAASLDVFPPFGPNAPPMDAGVQLTGNLFVPAPKPAPGTYQKSDAGPDRFDSNVTVKLPDGRKWTQSFEGLDGGTSELGTFRWDVTSVSDPIAVGVEFSYQVRGGYQGTLLGNDGCVAVTIAF